MEKINFKEFKAKALENEEIRKEYESIKPIYELKKKLISLRKTSGLTQEELAKKLHTQKSNISRLENVNSKTSPRLSTIEEYAKAMGYELEIKFTPVQ
jgi:DNA-binding XRE family transcriptional regulator